MTWAEVIRKLKAAGYVDHRSGKGSHRQLIHPQNVSHRHRGRPHQEGRRAVGQPHSQGSRRVMTASSYPVIFETEDSGAIERIRPLDVPGVYAACRHSSTGRASYSIRVESAPDDSRRTRSRNSFDTRAGKGPQGRSYRGGVAANVDLVGPAALLGRHRSGARRPRPPVPTAPRAAVRAKG